MKSFIVIGGLTFAASRYIFDSTLNRALLAGFLVGGLAYYISEQKPIVPVSVDMSPQV